MNNLLINIKKINDRLKYVRQYRLPLTKRKDVICTRNVFLDSNTFLEGNNYFGYGTYITNSKIGFSTYFAGKCRINMVKVGRFCSIAEGLNIIVGIHPTNEYISTSPMFYSNCHAMPLKYNVNNTFEEYRYASDNYYVTIGNDVWIGDSVSIMNGVHVADGVIIGAGALVTKDLEPYGIYGGVPAKLIKYRFPKKEIDDLLKFKWWNKSQEWIKKNAEDFTDINILREK